MSEPAKYYIVEARAMPEIFRKVAEAKRLLETGEEKTVNAAAQAVDISRSAFYKYKDDIFPFHDNARGRTITFVMQMDDVPGLLSAVLKIIAEYNGNILTINQTIPINGVASLTLSIDVLPITGDTSSMLEGIEQMEGIHYLKILGRE